MALLHKAASKAGTRTSGVLVLLAIGNLLCLQCNSQGIVEAYNSTFPNRYHSDVLAVSGTPLPCYARNPLRSS